MNRGAMDKMVKSVLVKRDLYNSIVSERSIVIMQGYVGIPCSQWVRHPFYQCLFNVVLGSVLEIREDLCIYYIVKEGVTSGVSRVKLELN